jgi:hypothetical protein
MKNNAFLPGAAAAVLVVIIIVAYAYWGGKVLDNKNNPAGMGGSEVTLTGKIVCLPHKGTGPTTMECAYGLQTADGKYYGLNHLWDVAPDLNVTQVAAQIVGTLTAPPASETYDVVGVIDVTSGKKI